MNQFCQSNICNKKCQNIHYNKFTNNDQFPIGVFKISSYFLISAGFLAKIIIIIKTPSISFINKLY